MDSTMPASTCSIRRDRVLGVLLHRLDDPADLLGRADRPFGQAADLVGHDGEALAGLARAGGLDRRVEGEEVGLVRDALDHLHDLPDLVRPLADRGDGLLQPLAVLAGLAPPTAGSPGPPGGSASRSRRRSRSSCRACPWPPRPRGGAPRRSADVWVSVALISWIEADVWSTFAASASALRARCCIWEAISTIVDEVSSVELDCISAPLAIWVERGRDLLGRRAPRRGRRPRSGSRSRAGSSPSGASSAPATRSRRATGSGCRW